MQKFALIKLNKDVFDNYFCKAYEKTSKKIWFKDESKK